MDAPNVSITAIGKDASGKTTFLHGMYHVMSSGQFGHQGYYLTADTPDTDARLGLGWEILRKEGKMPKPTDARPHSYPMTLRNGADDLLRFTWTDYRGAAMSGLLEDKDDHPDTQSLLGELVDSDSIYLVLDGFWLREALTPANRLDVMDGLGIRRLSYLVQHVCARRREQGRHFPSFVVLVTKSDRIKAAAGGGDEQERVVTDVRALLPVCFGPGMLTMVCPVRIGVFPEATGHQVDPTAVSPQRVHIPMLFSLSVFIYREYHERLASIEAKGRERQETAERDLKGTSGVITSMVGGAAAGTVLGTPVFGTIAGGAVGAISYRFRRRRREEELAEAEAGIRRLEADSRRVEQQFRWVAEEIDEVPVFLDGERKDLGRWIEERVTNGAESGLPRVPADEGGDTRA
ncbi:TRAFAC clade GTPase domain-containing protein [Streptomyces sp. NPDC001348]